MVNIVSEDEELDLLEELDDMYDEDQELLVHEMTDWVKFELDN
jgi:hypothetical protein